MARFRWVVSTRSTAWCIPQLAPARARPFDIETFPVLPGNSRFFRSWQQRPCSPHLKILSTIGRELVRYLLVLEAFALAGILRQKTYEMLQHDSLSPSTTPVHVRFRTWVMSKEWAKLKSIIEVHSDKDAKSTWEIARAAPGFQIQWFTH